MIASERSLWQWLTKLWKTLPKTEMHCDRVENIAGSGMPDVEGCYRRVQFWIELKVAARPKNPETCIDVKHLRAKQVEWLNNRWLVGGNAWILVRVGNDALYLVPGKWALQLRLGMTEKLMADRSALSGKGLTQHEVLLAATGH